MELRGLTLALGLAACAQRVEAPAGDAGIIDVTALSDTPADAPEVGRVRTCSELRLTEVLATPGSASRAYPGSRLVLRGDDLGSVDRVTVGGVEQPWTAEGAALVTEVPPMLAAGPQAVIVASERCSSAREITISRLLAWVPARGPRVTLLDLDDLATVGAVDTGLDAIAQASFTLDASTLLARDADGRVVAAAVRGARVAAAPARGAGAFVLAQGNVVPTAGLLAVPGLGEATLFRVDTPGGALTPVADAPSGVVSVSTTLDGFRALVLDRDGGLSAIDRPFARTPSWTRLPTPRFGAHPAEVVVEQGGATTIHGPLAAVFDASDPPALIPLDSLEGVAGERVPLPGAAGGLYFVSGDVLSMDTTTNEVITADITTLSGTVDRLPLVGESPVGVVRTQTATTLYRMAAVTLRRVAGGAAEGATLHLLDYHHEPATEERRVPIAGMRGVVGVQGRDDPFVVWTARAVLRVHGRDGTILQRRELGPAEGEAGRVVTSR